MSEQIHIEQRGRVLLATLLGPAGRLSVDSIGSRVESP